MTVERAARPIEITELTLLGLSGAALELVALCSKGTYIRVLAEDIAQALGTCGHVIALRRLYVEPFDHSPMQTLVEVEAACQAGRVPGMIAADAALPGMPAVRLPAELACRLAHGQTVVVAGGTPGGKVRLYDPQGRFMGLGEADAWARSGRGDCLHPDDYFSLRPQGCAGRMPRFKNGPNQLKS